MDWSEMDQSSRIKDGAHLGTWIAVIYCGDNHLPVYVQGTCTRDSTQAGAYEANIGSFLCCSGDSVPEQCTRCDIEN